MIRMGRHQSLACILTLFTIGGIGCRDTDPPPAHFRDLGTDSVPLLPTASVRQNPAIAGGQADWHPFREPSTVPTAAATPRTSEGEDRQDSKQIEGDDRQDSKQIEAEIRELIEEYNEVVADGTVDDLLDYYVEQQHETIRPFIESAAALAETLEQIRSELEAKMPEATDRIATVFGVLESRVRLKPVLDAITDVTDTAATGKMSGDSLDSTYRFLVVDEAWYIELQNPEDLSQLRSALDDVVSAYRGWLQDLQAGQAPPEDILQKLETRAKAARSNITTQPNPPSEP